MRAASEETNEETKHAEGTEHATLRVLGPPRLERDGIAVVMDTRKALALLAYLVMERRPHSRDTLAALLWPEYDQPHARAALRRTLSTLVKAIGADVLATERETLALRNDAPLTVDATTFLAHLATFRAHQHPPDELCPACRATLTRAVALYQGDFLSGFSLRGSAPFEDWQFTQDQALRRDLGIALARLTRDAASRGAYDDALILAQRWLALDRLNEQAHRYLMRLYAWTGQQSAALHQYRDCLQTLDRELGVAPLDVTTRLYEAIKQRRLARPAGTTTAATQTATHENGADHARPDTPPHAPATAATTATSVAALASAEATHAPQPRTAGTAGGPVPLIGRDAELRVALDAYTASAGAGYLLVVEGEAGIGKTRLAEEVMDFARAQGGAVILARCYAGEAALAYAPIAAALRLATQSRGERGASSPSPAERTEPGQPSDLWLSEAARLIPELREAYPHLAPASPLEGVGAQVRFFEGVRQVLLAACQGAAPGVLCFDDLQWADTASLDLLAYLVRRLSDHPVCLLLTWRSAEVMPSSPLRRMLADAQRAGHASAIHLQRLQSADVSTWVDLALGGGAGGGAATEHTLAERIYDETEGLPFFIREYVRALAGGTLGASSPDWTTPGTVHDLLRSRLLAVDDASQQVLAAAAILGRSFALDLVREVSGRSEEEALVAVEQLCAAGLVTEFGESAKTGPHYDFTHEKLRGLVLESMSAARRRLLHGRAAAALEHLARTGPPGQNESATAGLIAEHALAAGDTLAAARHFKDAGDRARALYAHADALRHYEQAHALGFSDPAALSEAMGDVLVMLANYGRAITAYELAAASSTPTDLWRLELKLGRVYARRGEWAIAESHLESADTRLEAADAPAAQRSAVAAERSLVARSSGRADEARSLAAHALTLAQEAGDDQALAQAHNILGMLARSAGDTTGAIAHLEESLALAERLADPGPRTAALNNLALALGESGRREDAIRAAEAALALAVAQGDRHHEAALHNNLADLLHFGGQTQAAMGHLTRSVAIYAEIGIEAGAYQPGVWMLADW